MPESMKLVSQVALIAATLAAVAGGVFYLVRDSSSDGGIEIALPTATTQPQVVLKAYVSGAVQSPGVYVIQDGYRLAQLLESAGGTTDDADLTAVNLSERVRDEDHWHVPIVGETPRATSGQEGRLPGKIDINSADAARLESLPGIGEVKVRSIIGYREANGPFSNVDDLLGVSGTGLATLEAIRDLVEAR